MKPAEQLTRRGFLGVIGKGLVAGMALSGDVLGGQSEFLYRKPNILMILVDDLGFGDLACQGAADMKTRHDG